jgi:hypothetical protein
MFHTGDRAYHPANRRVTLTVALDDLRVRYGLSDDATRFLVQVCSASIKVLLCLSE